MRCAFRPIARLGPGRDGYPWILADPRNWVLRLGPSRSEDEKYFSNLVSLLEGMTVHLLRRNLARDGVVDGIQRLIQEHRAAIAEAREFGQGLAVALGRSEPPVERRQAV